MRCLPVVTAVCCLLPLGSVSAQPKGFLYDEDKVPRYEPIDPLIDADGNKITTPEGWAQRRGEVLKLIAREMYGVAPAKPKYFRSLVVEESDGVLNGTAIRKQVLIAFGPNQGRTHQMEMLIYLPKNADKPVPVFLGLNFQGNHTIQPDPAIHITPAWVRKRSDGSTDGNRATEKGRGVASARWPVEQILARGYGLATIYYGDIDPDFDDGFQNGVHGVFAKRNQEKPAPHEWGSIAAWAYGLSRAMDYLETDGQIDHERVAVLGHSRLGKTSLWAGANDERFAIVISNNSGAGGAALSKRTYGETVKRLNTSFPHWFDDNFTKYNDRESDLPFDQHHLVAVIAPRPVYIASATGDQWADPKGEFLSGKLASPVYELLTGEGMPANSQPEPDQPVMGRIGYHLRTGKHNLTEYDWEQYMNFADRFWRD